MAKRRLRPGWHGYPLKLGGQVLGVVVVVALIWGLAPRVLDRMTFFRIRRVEIVGIQYLPPSTVLNALALDSHAGVFDDLSAAGRRLNALPGVVTAQVNRRLPGTLEIALVEAVPVALTPRSGGLALLDSSGNVLPFDPATSAPDVPIAATADPVVARVLATVKTHDPGLYSRVRTAWRVRDDVLLDVEGRRFWFGPAATAEEIRAVMAVAEDLARRGRRYWELDGRYAGQVIVRQAGV